MTRRIDKIKQYILNKLPESCGVYYFFDKEGNIIYIGKSLNMYQRAMSHFNSKESKGKKMLNDLYNVDFIETGSEVIALLTESEEIKKHKPKYNRMRKSHEFTHCIDWFTDDKGIINFKVVDFNESDNALLSFTAYMTARERVESWIDEHQLCMKYCALAGEDSVCFNHHIKKCNGICADQEDIEIYNYRAKQIVQQFSFPEPDFLIVDRGRNMDESTVIHIENGKYAGYGYVRNDEQVQAHEDLIGYVAKKESYPDATDLVKSWLRQNERVRKIILKEKTVTTQTPGEQGYAEES